MTMKTSIDGLTDPMIIKAFFGDKARRYSHTVTEEEFHEYDQEGPGTYTGVIVDTELAELYDAGIIACEERGIDTQSRAGYQLRFELMGREIHPLIENWLQKEEQELQEQMEFLESIKGLINGGMVVGADEYSGQWWYSEKRKELEVVAKNPYHIPTKLKKSKIPWGDTLPKMPGNEFGGLAWEIMYRLPNGDLFVVTGTNYFRITFDQSLMEEIHTRRKITGYEIQEDLWQAMKIAHEAFAFSKHGYWGSVWKNDYPVVGRDQSFVGMFGDEYLAKLKAYCEEIPSHPLVERVKQLAVDGSVKHVTYAHDERW